MKLKRVSRGSATGQITKKKEKRTKREIKKYQKQEKKRKKKYPLKGI